MMLASISLGPQPRPASAAPPDTRGLAHDAATLAAIAAIASVHLSGRTLTASIDDEGRWTCARSPRLEDLLNRFFGPAFEITAYYSPDHRSIEVARDAAFALGGRVLGAKIETEDLPDDVVF